MSKKSSNPFKVYRRVNNNILHSAKKGEISAKRIKGCLGKVGFDTEFEAEVVGAKLRKRTYKCKYCPHYHHTSKKDKSNQREA